MLGLWVLAAVAAAVGFAADPTIWLLQPQSRLSERNPTIQRMAEAKCPTPSKESDPKSTLPVGGIVDIIWNNPDAVRGPTRFELLSGDQIIATLEPIDPKEAAAHSKGTSAKAIRLPDFECKECILRLTQTLASTADTQVISCADIQLLRLSQMDNETRSQLSPATPECSANSDCGTDGECIPMAGVCFCSAGAYGLNCAQKSALNPLADDLEYNVVPMNESNSVKWRYDSALEELEFVVRLPTDSWMALGLRNREAETKCAALGRAKDNNLEDNDAENSLTGGHLNIQSLVNKYLTTAKPEAECGVNEYYEECPEFSRECEPSCDWTSFPESIPVCPKECGNSRCVCKEGFVRQGAENNECQPFEFCKAIQSECPTNQTWAKCGTACEPSCETMYSTAPCTSACKEPACSCADNYVRFNGECIYWANCPNLESRVLSAENISEQSSQIPTSAKPPKLSTLKLPTTKTSTITTKAPPGGPKCAANETWNECGKVCETDCVRIFDREECSQCAPAACACQQGFARLNGKCVYWGDCLAGDAANSEAIKQLTTPKAPKQLKNSAELPPADPEMLCFGEFAYPPKCEGADCKYKLSWAFIPENDEVEFSLSTEMSKPKGWSGVGFSPSGSMNDADFVIIKVDGEKVTINDAHADGYNSPIEDEVQNIQNAEGTVENGVLTASFVRKRRTEDSDEDAEFGDANDSQCFHFLFPVEAGPLEANGTIGPHSNTPLISSRKICIRACHGQTPEEPKTTTTPKLPAYTCQNEFRFPSNCSDIDCDYRARWAFDSKAKAVLFEVSAKGIGRWTGLGFSRDGEMTNADIYLGWVYGAKAYVMDRFAYGRQLPAIDPADRQDIYDVSGRVEDDIQTITFKRKLVTADKRTDFPLDKCYYFLFPIGGGRILTKKNSDFTNPRTPIGYHDKRAPERSAVPVCICDDSGEPVGEAPSPRRRRMVADPFDERSVPGDLSHLLPSANKPKMEDPFGCTDVSLIQLSRNGKLRVVDGFAVDSTSLQPDEAFGGVQSLADVSLLKVDPEEAEIVVRKKVKAEDIADFAFADEIGSLVVAAGGAATPLPEAPFVKTISVNFLSKQKPSNAESLDPKSTTTTKPAATTSESSTATDEETTIPFTDVDMQPQSSTTTTAAATTEATEPTVEWTNADPSDPNCFGVFTSPPLCTSKCDFSARWSLNEKRTAIRIQLESELRSGEWTAIGFSKDGQMAGSDAVVVSVRSDSTVSVRDHYSAGYGRPTIDRQQDLANVETRFADGRVNVSFVRPLRTLDPEDADLWADCYFVVFVPSGGKLEQNGEIQKHSATPILSANSFCASKCGVKMPTTSADLEETTEQMDKETSSAPSSSSSSSSSSSTTTTTTTTTTTSSATTTTKKRVQNAGNAAIPSPGKAPPEDKVFDSVLRVMGRDWGVHLENLDSPQAKAFTKDVIDNLKPLISKKWASLKGMDVTNYAYSTTTSIGVTEANHAVSPSILALTQFSFDPMGSPTAEELRNFLKEVSAQGLTGPLSVDPNVLQVKENQKKEIDEKWGPLRDIRNWTIIGVAVFFLLVLIVLCCFCAFRGGRRKTHPEAMSFGQPNVPSSYHHYTTSYPNGVSTFDKSIDTTKTSATNSAQNSESESLRREGKAAPKGIGETTYQEWYSKVASKDTPSHHQETLYQTPPQRLPIAAAAPAGFYEPTAAAATGYYDTRLPPPSYYRHY